MSKAITKLDTLKLILFFKTVECGCKLLLYLNRGGKIPVSPYDVVVVLVVGGKGADDSESELQRDEDEPGGLEPDPRAADVGPVGSEQSQDALQNNIHIWVT
jgi:hypothetical protein